MMVQSAYEPPTMKLTVWQKDMRLIKAFAQETGSATPLFDTTIPLYLAAVAEGHGQMDTAAVRLALEASAEKVLTAAEPRSMRKHAFPQHGGQARRPT